MFHAAQDEVVPYYDAVDTAKAWCLAGAKIDFVTGNGSVPIFGNVGHLVTPAIANGGAQFWLSVLMNGGTAPSGCSWNTQDATGLGTYTSNTGVPSPLHTHGTGY